MIKQVVFLKRRPDMTMQQFMDYYENQHSQLSKRIGAKPASPNAQREDFEAAMRGLGNPEHLEARLQDERKLFATNSNPVCIVEEHDSPVGPENRVPRWVPAADV